MLSMAAWRDEGRFEDGREGAALYTGNRTEIRGPSLLSVRALQGLSPEALPPSSDASFSANMVDDNLGREVVMVQCLYLLLCGVTGVW